MNAFSKPMNLRPEKMTAVHGRKGQPTEFVEYRLHRIPIRYFAQKSGDQFVIMRAEVNKRGRVHSTQFIGSSYNADSAAHWAHDAAMNEAEK